MIVIRKDAIGVYSVAMLTLQGARSQLKICADQTACPRRARLSQGPRLLLQRDGQAQGLSLPPNRLQRSWPSYARRSPPCDLVRDSATPISGMLYRARDDRECERKRSRSVHNQTSVRKRRAPIWSPQRSFVSSGEQARPSFPSHSWARALH